MPLISLPHRKNLLRLRLFCVFLATLAVASGCVPVGGQRAPAYVLVTDLPPQLLPTPTAEGSAAWKNEIHSVIAVQKDISPQEVAAIRDEQRMRIELVTNIIGAGFSRERYPDTFELLDNVYADMHAVSEADKGYWHIRRPYLTDTHVRLLVDPIDQSPAYPSGHTGESRVLAEVLGLLFPERLEELRARAATIAQHRVEAGVHYPMDLEGGRTLAMLFMGALTKNKAFQSDLSAARAEIAAAR